MPVQRPDKPSPLELRVQPVGLLERARVDGDDRVEERTALVVGLDPIEVLLRERAGGQRALRERGVDVGDRRFNDLERRGCRPATLCMTDDAGHNAGDRDQLRDSSAH